MILHVKWDFLLNPLFYLTIALFVGEATLEVVGLPIDYKASAMYFIMLVGIILGVRAPLTVHMNSVFLLYIYIIIRNIPTTAEYLESYWLPNMLTLVLFALAYGHCSEKKENISAFLNFTYGFLMILMVLGVAKAISSEESGRLAVFGGPNGYYKFALFFEALSFIRYVETKKVRYLLFMVLGIILSLLTGSKGAILTICVLIPVEVWYYLFKAGSSRRKVSLRLFQLAVASVAGIGAMAVLISTNPTFGSVWGRGTSIFSENAGELTSVSARSDLLAMSWEYFCQAPVFGMGGKYMYYDTLYTSNPQPYAHNIFFELLGEQGLVGFLLLCVILVKLLLSVKKKYLADGQYASFYLGFLVYFMGAQFSGGILDSKVLLFFAMMILMYKRQYLRPEERRTGIRWR